MQTLVIRSLSNALVLPWPSKADNEQVRKLVHYSCSCKESKRFKQISFSWRNGWNLPSVSSGAAEAGGDFVTSSSFAFNSHIMRFGTSTNIIVLSYDINNQLAKFEKNLRVGSISVE